MKNIKNCINREFIERTFRYEGWRYRVLVDKEEARNYLAGDGDFFSIIITCYDPEYDSRHNPEFVIGVGFPPFPDNVIETFLKNEGILTPDMCLCFRDCIQNFPGQLAENYYKVI